VSDQRTDANWNSTRDADDPSLVEQIKMLVEAMAGTSITELELVEDGLEIHLQRSPVGAFVPANVTVSSNLPMTTVVNTEQLNAPAEMSLAVLAPLTGVFYISPSPSSPPFVQPGETVQPGQVVCIVEAMKVFNEIKTEIGGTVVAIPPKAGDLVKKGDPLVRIKPL